MVNLLLLKSLLKEALKYINNAGTLCGTSNYIHMKAESLCHYFYVKSHEKLMVVDI